MSDPHVSPNKVTTNNLNKPHEKQSSASSGGHSPGRSDKTNSVDDESMLKERPSKQDSGGLSNPADRAAEQAVDQKFKSSDETLSIEEDSQRKVEGTDRGFEI